MLESRLRHGSCRLCLWETSGLWDVFGELAESRNFVLKIKACVNIVIERNDGMSSLICHNCMYKIELFYDFQANCKRSEELQKRYYGFQDLGRVAREARNEMQQIEISAVYFNSEAGVEQNVREVNIKEEPINEEDMAHGGCNDIVDEGDMDVTVESCFNEVPSCVTVLPSPSANEDLGDESCFQVTPRQTPSVVSDDTWTASDSEQHEADEPPEPVSVEDEISSCRDNIISDHLESGNEQSLHQTNDTHFDSVSGLQCSNEGEKDKDKLEVDCAYHTDQCRFCKKLCESKEACEAHEVCCGSKSQNILQVKELPQRKRPTPANQCSFCLKVFKSKFSCRYHEVYCGRKHTLKKLPSKLSTHSNKCRFCNKWFQKQHFCKLHEVYCGSKRSIQKYTEISKCRICGAEYDSPRRRKAHEYHCRKRLAGGATGAVVKCTHCGKSFSTKEACSAHEELCVKKDNNINTRNNYVHLVSALYCKYCQVRFRTKVSRCKHEIHCPKNNSKKAVGFVMKEKRLVSTQSPASVLKCKYCEKGHLKWRSLMTHEYHCMRKKKCSSSVPSPLVPSNEKSSDTVDVSNGSAISSAENSQKEICEIRSHCKVCGKPGENFKVLKIHEWHCKRIHDKEKVINSTTNPQENASAIRNQCKICEKTILNPRGLKVHEWHCKRINDKRRELDRVINSQKEVQKLGGNCRICGKSISNITGLKVHEWHCKLIHDGKPQPNVTSRRCPKCNKWFVTRKARQYHIKFCLRLLKKNSSRKKHVVNEKFAPTLFTKESDLGRKQQNSPSGSTVSKDKEHDQQEETSENENNNHKDDILLVNKTDLIKKIREDISLTSQMKCRHCSKPYKYQESLRSHELMCFPDTTSSVLMGNLYHQKKSDSYRYFKCRLCRKAFRFRRKLHNHWKVCRARSSVMAEAAGKELNVDIYGEKMLSDTEDLTCNVMSGLKEIDCKEENVTGDLGKNSDEIRNSHDLDTGATENNCNDDSVNLSCKFCLREFSSKILLQLHTVNECVSQHIHNDHAYAQCESTSIDESTLMRRARVELQRLFLCAHCGQAFQGQQELDDHKIAERHFQQEDNSYVIKSSDNKDLSVTSVKLECEELPLLNLVKPLVLKCDGSASWNVSQTEANDLHQLKTMKECHSEVTDQGACEKLGFNGGKDGCSLDLIKAPKKFSGNTIRPDSLIKENVIPFPDNECRLPGSGKQNTSPQHHDNTVNKDVKCEVVSNERQTSVVHIFNGLDHLPVFSNDTL